MTNFLNRPMLIASLLFVAALGFYGHLVLSFPTTFNPDSIVNHAATSYLSKYRAIPVIDIDTEGVEFSSLGTTRLLRPPLTYIVSAAVASSLEEVIKDRTTTQRLGSALLGAMTVVIVFVGFWFAFERIGLALLGSVLIGLMPKFVFLSSSNNDDIGAILSVSTLFFVFLGTLKHRHHNSLHYWLVAICASAGLVFVSKYTAWLTLPWFGLLALLLIRPAWQQLQMSTRVILIPMSLLALFLMGGWWIIFNMAHYGITDPTALNHAAELQRTLTGAEANRRGYSSLGVGVVDLLGNYDQFVSNSYKSLVGYLQWIELEMSPGTYLFYALIIMIGIGRGGWSCCSLVNRSRVGSAKPQDWLEPVLLLMIIAQCCFYLHHNMLRDVQPQARYVLPILMPLVYLVLGALRKINNDFLSVTFLRRNIGFQSIAIFFLASLCITTFINTLTTYVKPSFIASSFYTDLKDTKTYTAVEALQITSATGLEYKYLGTSLELSRTDRGIAAVELDDKLCDLLPLNALILLKLKSGVAGGVHLRLDQHELSTFGRVFWAGYKASDNVALLTVNSEGCSGAKLSLTNGTHILTIESIQISTLGIHQYGQPL